MKEKKELIFKILIIIIILSLGLILKNEIFQTKKDEKQKVYKLSSEKCTIESNELIKKQEVEYNNEKHNIELKLIKNEDGILKTEVYIDKQLINTINTGLSEEKLTCNSLKTNLYILDSKYLAILSGKYEKDTIEYNLYFYNENKVINKDGEKLFTYKTNKEESEKIEGYDKTLELENIEFDGSSFKHFKKCSTNTCNKEIIKFDGTNIIKEIEQNQEELTVPY